MTALHLVFTFCVLFCVTRTSGSLDDCSLYTGGDFIYSSSGEITSGFLKYNIGSRTFDSVGNVYHDGHVDSLFVQNSNLFFAGDIVRSGSDESMSIGKLDIRNTRLSGVSSGLWTQGNILPTVNGNISPSLLFAPWGDSILVAGRFTHQNSNPSVGLSNIAQYEPSTSSYTPLPHAGLCSECSIIAMSSDINSGRIYVATMDTNSFQTQVLYLEEDQWSSMPNPTVEGVTNPLRILFDSFTLISNEALVAIAYSSSSGLLNDVEVQYYLVSWDLAAPTSSPTVVSLWDKSCSEENNSIMYPAIDNLSDSHSFVAAIPSVFCPTDDTSIDFELYNSALEKSNSTIPSITSYGAPKLFQAISQTTMYISQGRKVSMLHSGSWAKMMENANITALYGSDSDGRLYTAFHNGYEQTVQSTLYNSFAAQTLFTGGIYRSGQVLAIAEMSDSKFMIGGDFKYVSGSDGSIIGAKFAALWDNGHWKATLESNANNYLPGWRLLSISSVGETVFGFADSGPDASYLPVIRWREDDGWLFLYNRPAITDSALYDNSVGTVHVDRTRNHVYFGGQFHVRLASSDVCSGGVVYRFLEDGWAPLPANLTKINSFESLNSHAYMQIGGQFSYTDANSVHHENYIVLDIEEQTILSSVPSISDAEVFAMSLFPNQPIYSFVGGSFGQYGVEELRFVSSIWSLSVVGNSPLRPVVYAMASRNEGESLFAGGSFEGHLTELDIGRQEWKSLIPSSNYWIGDVRSLMLQCPGDSDYYSENIDWDDSSLLDSFYSVAHCTIPLGAPDDYVCPEDQLSVGQMVGLGFTILVTIAIIGVVAFFAYRQFQKQKELTQGSVEYL